MSTAWHDVFGNYRYRGSVDERGFGGRPILTGIEGARIAPYVLLTVRDPLVGYEEDPALQMARKLDEFELAAQSGMFTTYTGTRGGVEISIVSGGSGGGDAELVMHEFIQFSAANTFIRVGGSGGLHPRAIPGDLVIATGVVRDEGMTRQYVDAGYPAVSHPEVVAALTVAAHRSGHRYHQGITRSGDSEFVGTGRPGVRGYFQPAHAELLDYWARAGVLNTEREAAAVVTLASLAGVRGGALNAVAENVITGAKISAGAGASAAVEVALDACVVLAGIDRQKRESGEEVWIPHGL